MILYSRELLQRCRIIAFISVPCIFALQSDLSLLLVNMSDDPNIPSKSSKALDEPTETKADEMDERLKLVMIMYEDDHPVFSVQGWESKAAKVGLSIATAK